MSKQPLTARRSNTLQGEAQVPGDKSISHRALMLSLLARGRSTVSGLLEGEDVLATAAAMRALGGTVTKHNDGQWSVDGVGLGQLKQPSNTLDMGNSGTAARLLIGLLSTHPISAQITGDASLRSRPMRRVFDPLSDTGAHFDAQPGGRLPLQLRGSNSAYHLKHRLSVASAQVKSALLLAALNLPGTSVIEDPFETRDHSENMLRYFGADIRVERADDASRIVIAGRPILRAQHVDVPADPSSAAFPMVAALIVPGAHVTIPNVCVNPTRTGLFEALRLMNATITEANLRDCGGEPVADMTVRSANLKGAELPATMIPRMVDEVPILAIAAAHADGTTVLRGLAELRIKESDRLAAVHAGLTQIGVTAQVENDDLIIHGCGSSGIPGGGDAVVTHYDHRIAMSFLIAGMASTLPITVDDSRAIATSFPNFIDVMTSLGGVFHR
ncbi:MAG: 3-phosphoshikimate 1-carboxyvinyltransferase [Pseudomonadota bacterium]